MKQITLTLLAFLPFNALSSCERWDIVYLTKTDPDTLLIFAKSRSDLFYDLNASIKGKGSFPTSLTYYSKNASLCEYAPLESDDFPYAVAVGVRNGKTRAMIVNEETAEHLIKDSNTQMFPHRLNGGPEPDWGTDHLTDENK